jgi:hypothetical protein
VGGSKRHQNRARAWLGLLGLLLGFAGVPRQARAADPAVAECLGAAESSVTLRHQHKLLDARAQLLKCSAPSCPGDVREECIRHVVEINAAMPTIVFEAQDASGTDLISVKVLMDGHPITERLDGTPVAIDPGAHTFTFERAGQTTIRKQFAIREGEKNRRERIVFGGLNPPAHPQATGPASVLPSSTDQQQSAEPAAGSFGARRVLAIVAAGVGAVGLGIGIVYGLESKSKHDQAQNICPGTCMTQTDNNLWRDAIHAGDIATIGFVVAGVGLAGGAVLWFTGGPEKADTATAGLRLGPGTIEIAGRW